MIASVSMFARSRQTNRPRCFTNGSMLPVSLVRHRNDLETARTPRAPGFAKRIEKGGPEVGWEDARMCLDTAISFCSLLSSWRVLALLASWRFQKAIEKQLG